MLSILNRSLEFLYQVKIYEYATFLVLKLTKWAICVVLMCFHTIKLKTFKNVLLLAPSSGENMHY